MVLIPLLVLVLAVDFLSLLALLLAGVEEEVLCLAWPLLLAYLVFTEELADTPLVPMVF